MDRQIRGIQREEQKVVRQIKDAVKKGSVDAAKILAKEMVQSRRAVNKMYASKAQLNSISMQMDHQLGECTPYHGPILFTTVRVA